MKFKVGDLVTAKALADGGVPKGWWSYKKADAPFDLTVDVWLDKTSEDSFFIVLKAYILNEENLYTVYCQNTCSIYIAFERELHEV